MFSCLCYLCPKACHQLSNLIFVFCGSKPSSEATPYDIKYPLLSSGRPVTARKTREKFREKERKKREKSVRKDSWKIQKNIQRRGVSMDNSFSPSCDFNQWVLECLRAEDLASWSRESPMFFSLWFWSVRWLWISFCEKFCWFAYTGDKFWINPTMDSCGVDQVNSWLAWRETTSQV